MTIDTEKAKALVVEMRKDNEETTCSDGWRACASYYAYELEELITAAESAPVVVEKRAPVQGFVQGIPWHMHLEAYNAYCKEYGAQPALIDLEGRNCRGGFGTRELDHFIPGWRDRLSAFEALKRENAELRAALTAALSHKDATK